MDCGRRKRGIPRTRWIVDITEFISPHLPTFYEIKAEDLPLFGKKTAEDYYARKI